MAILRTATLPSALGLVAALFISSGRTQAAAPAGSIQITVDDAQGEPMSGVTIQYTRLPKTVIDGARELPAPGEIAVHGEVATNASGIATVASLPVGNYTLCAAMLRRPFPRPVYLAAACSGRRHRQWYRRRGAYLDEGRVLKCAGERFNWTAVPDACQHMDLSEAFGRRRLWNGGLSGRAGYERGRRRT